MENLKITIQIQSNHLRTNVSAEKTNFGGHTHKSAS